MSHPPFSFHFLTAWSAQWCCILVEKHCTVHQDTWILHLAQPEADIDLEQVFTPVCPFCTLRTRLVPAAFNEVLSALGNLDLREAVNMQEEQQYWMLYRKEWPYKAQREEFVSPLAAAAAVQQLKGPLWCCALDPQPGLESIHQLCSVLITVLSLQTKWKSSLVAKIQCGISCSIPEYFIFFQGFLNLFVMIPKELPPLSHRSISVGSTIFYRLEKKELPWILII